MTLTKHFLHNGHWMVDVAGIGAPPDEYEGDRRDAIIATHWGGGLVRPDRTFRFVDGTLVVEFDVAAGMLAYHDGWPEIVVTFRHLEEGWIDTPEPRRDRPRRRRRGRGEARGAGSAEKSAARPRAAPPAPAPKPSRPPRPATPTPAALPPQTARSPEASRPEGRRRRFRRRRRGRGTGGGGQPPPPSAP